MICAEDEIGLGKDHAGIMVLPAKLRAGSAVAEYFKPYSDFIYEIGLTPNHMDAMSHIGVARDVCACLSHQDKKDYRVKHPGHHPRFRTEEKGMEIEVDAGKSGKTVAVIPV